MSYLLKTATLLKFLLRQPADISLRRFYPVIKDIKRLVSERRKQSYRLLLSFRFAENANQQNGSQNSIRTCFRKLLLSYQIDRIELQFAPNHFCSSFTL